MVDLDRTSPSNWLNDANLWMRTAYHQIRAPLPIHSNWWLLLQDDPNVPLEVRQGQGVSQEVRNGNGVPQEGRNGNGASHEVRDGVSQEGREGKGKGAEKGKEAEKGEEGGRGTTGWQVRRAAWLVSRFLEYREKLEGCVVFYFLYCSVILWLGTDFAHVWILKA